MIIIDGLNLLTMLHGEDRIGCFGGDVKIETIDTIYISHNNYMSVIAGGFRHVQELTGTRNKNGDIINRRLEWYTGIEHKPTHFWNTLMMPYIIWERHSNENSKNR